MHKYAKSDLNRPNTNDANATKTFGEKMEVLHFLLEARQLGQSQLNRFCSAA